MHYGFGFMYPKFNPETDTIVAVGIGVMIIETTFIVG